MLEIYYADHREAAGQKRLPAATNMDRELFPVAEKLMRKILTRRIRVRKLAVRYFQLRPASAQISLFENPEKNNSDRGLNRAMDNIRQRFGEEAVRFSLGE